MARHLGTPCFWERIHPKIDSSSGDNEAYLGETSKPRLKKESPRTERTPYDELVQHDGEERERGSWRRPDV